MTDKCAGCGSSETIEEIKARNPDAISCCPERKMVKLDDMIGDYRIVFFPRQGERRFGMQRLFEVKAWSPTEALELLYAIHPDAKVCSLVNTQFSVVSA